MRVFVAGGTGAIGCHAVPALVRAGHRVVALARTPLRAAQLTHRGAEPLAVDLRSRGTDQRTLRCRCDCQFGDGDSVVLACRIGAGLGGERPASAPTALVDAAIAAGVARVVQESACFLHRDQADAWIDERSPTDVNRALPAIQPSMRTLVVGDILTPRRVPLLAAGHTAAWLKQIETIRHSYDPGRIVVLSTGGTRMFFPG